MSFIKLGERLDQRLYSAQRSKLREKFGVSNNVPVLEDEVSKPKLIGENGGWFTRGGTPIHAPSSYAKSGWSNMVYQTSTQVIVVPKGTKFAQRFEK